MGKWKQAAAGCLLALLHVSAQGAIHCEGRVSYALLYSDGTVNIQGAWRGDYTYLCNIHGTRGNISAETCLSWFAAASKATADGKVLAVYYETDSYTCANLPIYALALNPLYVGIKGP